MNIWNYIRASLVLLGILLNTVVMVIPLYLFTLARMAIRHERTQIALARVLVRIAESWMWVNNTLIGLISRPRWQIEGLEGLSKDQWYLVTSNHQSWADILVLQKVFNRRIPMLKFFLKQELIRVPLLGHAWWALDFPFMKRHTREEIERDPSLKGKDLETTRKACEKFAHFPTSVMNFFEGTRFTQAKHDQQQSPYQHLLKPKAGGTAFALGAMGGKLGTLLDVTIVYPQGVSRSLMAFLGGAIRDIQVVIRPRPIPEWASQGDYENDPAFRARFQAWISDLWAEKDALLQARLAR